MSSHEVQIHFDLKLPVRFEKNHKLMTAQECISIFNHKMFNRFWNNPLLSCICCTSKTSEGGRAEEEEQEQHSPPDSNLLQDFSMYMSKQANSNGNYTAAKLKGASLIANSRKIYDGKQPKETKRKNFEIDTEQSLTRNEKFKVINTMHSWTQETTDYDLGGHWPEYAGPIDESDSINAFEYEHGRKFVKLKGLGALLEKC